MTDKIYNLVEMSSKQLIELPFFTEHSNEKLSGSFFEVVTHDEEGEQPFIFVHNGVYYLTVTDKDGNLYKHDICDVDDIFLDDFFSKGI